MESAWTRVVHDFRVLVQISSSFIRRERLLVPFFLGPIAFWSVSVIVHIRTDSSFSGTHVDTLTWAMPLTSILVLAAFAARSFHPVFSAATMTLGIWSLGPWFILFSASLSGGGFAGSPSDALFAFLLAAFTTVVPILTFNMSAHDGSLFGLVIATVLLPVAGGTIHAFKYALKHLRA